MKGIQHHFHVWFANRLDIANRLFALVEHIAFKSIEHLHIEGNSVYGREAGELPDIFNAALGILSLVEAIAEIDRPIGVKRAADAINAGQFHFMKNIRPEAKSALNQRRIRGRKVVLRSGAISAAQKHAFPFGYSSEFPKIRIVPLRKASAIHL